MSERVCEGDEVSECLCESERECLSEGDEVSESASV